MAKLALNSFYGLDSIVEHLRSYPRPSQAVCHNRNDF